MTTSREDETKARESANRLYKKAHSDPVEKLRLFCLSKGQGGVASLGRMFRGFDDDHNYKIPKEEFIKGLCSYGVEMSRKEMEVIFKAMDKDRSGFIVYDEFLNDMRPPMSDRRVDIVLRCFDKLDITGDGIISSDDLKNKLDMSHNEDVVKGKTSSSDVMKRFLRNFEGANGDGNVTEQEFVNYYSGVSASIDDDDYFIYMMERAYHLDDDSKSGSGGRSRRGGSSGRDRKGSDGGGDSGDERHRGESGKSRDSSPKSGHGRKYSRERSSASQSGGGRKRTSRDSYYRGR